MINYYNAYIHIQKAKNADLSIRPSPDGLVDVSPVEIPAGNYDSSTYCMMYRHIILDRFRVLAIAPPSKKLVF